MCVSPSLSKHCIGEYNLRFGLSTHNIYMLIQFVKHTCAGLVARTNASRCVAVRFALGSWKHRCSLCLSQRIGSHT